MAPKTNGQTETFVEESNVPTVVGINFGNSYASIAVLTKEGLAECIANEDGERQIACAIAFHGEEVYIGNQAKSQLVKNSENTIVGFRNLLGKKFSELPKDKPVTSAPVIQHPTQSDTPAFKVKVLEPAPAPIGKSSTSTPAASSAPTPRSEPTPAERVLSVSDATTLFLKSLLQSAEDFLGKSVTGAVIVIPSYFVEAQRLALVAAAEAAGIKVLQLLDDAGATLVATTDLHTSQPDSAANVSKDRTQLVVDLGVSSLELTIVAVREGLGYTLASSSTSSVSAAQIDAKLIKFFAKEFTKKTKTPLTVAPATETLDKRAEAKLLLAVEHTKRTLSASPGAATCSVESLKEGLDYTGSINRMRFDMEVRSVYNAVLDQAKSLAAGAALDLYQIDEIIYVGGSACLPGLDETLADSFREDVITPFKAGTVLGGLGDPTTILARGAVHQAMLVSWLDESTGASRESEKLDGVRAAFETGSTQTSTKVSTQSLALLLPGSSELFPIVLKDTPLPTRRSVSYKVGGSAASAGVELWEVSETIKITKQKPPPVEYDDDEEEEEEEEEEIEVKELVTEKKKVIGAATVDLKGSKDRQVLATVTVSTDGLVGFSAVAS